MKTSNQELGAEGLKHLQAHIENQESDIKLMAMHFEAAKCAWKSFEEMDAYNAQQEINLARRRLIELHEEIERQQLIIKQAQINIQTYKTNINSGQMKKVGKPHISETQKTLIKRFMAKWIQSLMEVLEVKNCRKLEERLSVETSLNSERNWRRWLNGDAVPTYKTFETLLNTKIVSGTYSKQSLQFISTIPKSDDLLTLLRFT